MSAPPFLFDKRTLWASVTETLAKEIGDGALLPGDRLPAESALMDRFGCSRHTVRRALSELVDLGMLRVEHGRGAFVHDTALHYRLSSKVTHSANLMREGRRPSSRVLDVTTRPADGEIAVGLGIEAGAPVRAVRSLSLADALPTSVSLNYVDAARWPGVDLAPGDALSMSRLYAAMGVADYRRLSTVILSRPPSAEEARLLEQPRSRWVMVTRKTDGGPDRTPVCYGVTAWSADRVQFVIDPDDA
ncbi:MAG: phosphonate metabolism transcriptional regulator PhnF [Pseudomonadota bacterium]